MMAREITDAYIYVPTMKIDRKRMTFDEVKAFCQENNLGIWSGTQVVSALDFKFEPKWVRIMEYCFDTGNGYYTEPDIILVPFGTTVEYGMFQFPK